MDALVEAELEQGDQDTPYVTYICGKPIKHNIKNGVTKRSEDFMNYIAQLEFVEILKLGEILENPRSVEICGGKNTVRIDEDWSDIQTLMYFSMTTEEYAATKHLLGTLSYDWFSRIEYDSASESELSEASGYSSQGLREYEAH